MKWTMNSFKIKSSSKCWIVCKLGESGFGNGSWWAEWLSDFPLLTLIPIVYRLWLNGWSVSNPNLLYKNWGCCVLPREFFWNNIKGNDFCATRVFIILVSPWLNLLNIGKISYMLNSTTTHFLRGIIKHTQTN